MPIETDVLAVAPSDEPAVAFTHKGGCRNRWGVRGGRTPFAPTANRVPPAAGGTDGLGSHATRGEPSVVGVRLVQQGVFESGDTLGDLLAVFALARGFGDIVQQRGVRQSPLLVEGAEPLVGVGGQVRVNRARLEP